MAHPRPNHELKVKVKGFTLPNAQACKLLSSGYCNVSRPAGRLSGGDESLDANQSVAEIVSVSS